MLNHDDAMFLLQMLGGIIVLIIVILWLLEPDPYDEAERLLDELEVDSKPECAEPSGCHFGRDIGMPEYRCAGKCQYTFRNGKACKD